MNGLSTTVGALKTQVGHSTRRYGAAGLVGDVAAMCLLTLTRSAC